MRSFYKRLAAALISLFIYFIVFVPLIVSSSLPAWLILILTLAGAVFTAISINYFIHKDQQ